MKLKVLVLAMIVLPCHVFSADGNGGQTLRYKCGSMSIEVQYASDGKSALLKGYDVKMEAQPTEAGIHFAGGHHVIRGSARDNIEFKWGREDFRKCSVSSK